MFPFLIFTSLLLKLFPYFVIIKKTKKLGEYLNLSWLFLGIILLGLSANIIRDAGQIISIFFLSNEDILKYLNIYFFYQIVYIVGIFLAFSITEKLFILKNLFFPFLFTKLKKIPKSIRKLLNFSYSDLSLIFIFLSICIFILILLFSSAGLNWITNPRYAYMTGRTGIGPFFVAYIISLSLSSFYLGSSRIDFGLKRFKILNSQYLIKFSSICYLSFLSGSKGVLLSIVATQLCFYLSTKENLNLPLLLGKLYKKFIIKKIIIYFFISIILLFSLFFYLLKGSNLINYFSDYLILKKHLDFTLENSSAFGFPGKLFFQNFLKVIPRTLREFFQLPLYTSTTIILEKIFSTENSDLYKINTPTLDPILLSVNIWGSKFYYFGALLSAFFRILPIALIFIMYKKYNYFYYSKSYFLPLFAVFLNYFPLMNIFVVINIITFLP